MYLKDTLLYQLFVTVWIRQMKAEITQISFSPGSSSAQGVFMSEQRAAFAAASLLPAPQVPALCRSVSLMNQTARSRNARCSANIFKSCL